MAGAEGAENSAGRATGAQESETAECTPLRAPPQGGWSQDVKASHALRVCFADHADQYVVECFRMKPDEDRLYNIRNASSHGDVDADNPSELMRVEDRHGRLWMIVFGMLGLIIPIDRPRDQP